MKLSASASTTPAPDWVGFSSPPPLTLYVHIPWCVRKCPYCDFNSHPVHETLPEKAYFQALLADLDQHLPQIAQRPIHSIFIGGGTPSLLTPNQIAHFLDNLQHRLMLTATVEITLEANPGTFEKAKFAEFQQAGINRLSLGIQSFEDSRLKMLGRIHTRQQALSALQTTADLFDNFNVDLMFNLPQQTVETALNDLKLACDFQPPHLSWYQLTIEPNTWFYHHPPLLPEDEVSWAIQTAGDEYLTMKNYLHYEISAYGFSNHFCQHNLNYWQFGDYLGIGAGAHSKLTDITTQQVSRFSKPRQPQQYLQTAGTAQLEFRLLNQSDLCLEFMMNSLRLAQGFSIAQFTTHTGFSIQTIAKQLAEAYQRQWLIQTPTRIFPTALGQRFLNDLLELFMD